MARKHPLISRIRTELELVADESRAPQMAAYMRDQFEFIGVTADKRRIALASAIVGYPKPDAEELVALARELWNEPEREFQYVACDLLIKWYAVLPASFVEEDAPWFITHKSWWDSVDSIRATVGALVLRHPDLEPVMFKWVESENKWLVRSALIHQLTKKHFTSEDRLFALCERRAADTEFFIAKAVGWALRDYSHRNPESVEKFVQLHPELSALAKREGLKAINARK